MHSNHNLYSDHRTVTICDLIVKVGDSRIADLREKDHEERKRKFTRAEESDADSQEKVGDKGQSVSPMVYAPSMIDAIDKFAVGECLNLERNSSKTSKISESSKISVSSKISETSELYCLNQPYGSQASAQDSKIDGDSTTEQL